MAACAPGDAVDGVKPTAEDRDQALDVLQRQAGAPVKLELSEAGTARVLAMTPQFLVAGHVTDPTEAAKAFLATHHDVFQLSASDTSSFTVARVDVEPKTGLRHITLARTYDGIPVFQGAMTVHMDSGNNVFRVLGDEFYRISAPTNTQVLTPSEAVMAAGKALGISLAPTVASSDGLRTVFTAPGTLDPINVEPRIFQVAPDDNRFAYQATVSWLDDHKQQQYQLAVIDAQDGSLLANHSLVNTFSGRVFTASPGAHPTTDTRQVVSFNGDPTASPSGWVGAANNTVGNNALACTDLNANNTCGTNETQPVADASGNFDFPFSPTMDAASFKPAAVASAFYLVNDYHDRTYNYGFTEAAGNFQTNNFGRGGLASDEVQIDSQDGSGTNNANFATPPDGTKPRMQMFLFNLVSGSTLRQDGDFDPGVIYHENSHGLSNRLVGGGSTACLNGLQSGGMGEGWGDFLGASFLNDPVVGAYVTGNATVGIRRQSMGNSTFTYNDIKNGTLAEVHDAGELWAATLWTIRNGIGGVGTGTGMGALGATATEALVVQGMKLTPCHPTMLQARDGILAADDQLNGGVNRCKLWRAFASRLMGTGASSPNENSQSTIVTSNAIPVECSIDGVTRLFTSTDVPKNIP
ncbi:MAG TPA: extracellular metalloproteinase, partial [Kofleriaceae bacterium]|nr:extracellular metalloproteinase [Kofleriaceae bacterium]